MIIEHTDFLFVFNKKIFSNELSIWDNHVILYINGKEISRVGSFFVDGMIYDRSKESLRAESASLAIDSIEDAPLGEYACCILTEDYAKFFTDPLGGYSIYFYSLNDVCIVSNSFSAIFEYIKKNNYPYTINIESVLNSAFVGCPFYPSTGINEVELLSPWFYLTIDRHGTLTIRERNNWIFYSYVAEGKITYSDVLHWTADRLIKKAKIAAENSEKLIVQVTAGCDSRLVLASLLASGNNNFHIETSGNCFAPDQRFSQLVGDILGIDHVLVRANGVSFNTIREKNLSLCGVYAPLDRSWEYESPFEFSVMTGAFGELCRGAWTRKVYDVQYMCGLEYFKGNISPNIYAFFAWQHFYTDDFKKNYYQQSLAFFEKLHSDVHSIPDLILFYAFSRYHFGQQLRNANRCFCKTFSILNDPIFHALYYAQDLSERINFKSVYDLIILLYPPLAFMPFEKERLFTSLDEKYLRIHNFIKLPEKSHYSPEIIDVRKNCKANILDEKEYFEFFQNEKFSSYFVQKSFERLKVALKREQVFRRSYHALCFIKNASINFV